MSHFTGFDVGTGSARAGLLDDERQLPGTGACAIDAPRPGYAQQDSAVNRAAICTLVRAALAGANVPTETDLGFNASCSLEVSGADGAPGQDVMLWMDHRAIDDAAEINAIGADVPQL